MSARHVVIMTGMLDAREQSSQGRDRSAGAWLKKLFVPQDRRRQTRLMKNVLQGES